jgi:hypothetical protein
MSILIMRKFKYILAFIILVTATLAIRGGTKTKPCVIPREARGLIKSVVVQGFPDLVSFSGFTNQ